MARYLIALGSSHANGDKYIQNAIDKIKNHRFLTFSASSRIYRNNSLGTNYNSLFYNSVCAINAALQPQVFYRELMCIEYEFGRIRSYQNARRTIDIDVLMSLEFRFMSLNFALPHREALTRQFFVIPAIEALKLASWPIPFKVLEARAKLGQGYLCPLP